MSKRYVPQADVEAEQAQLSMLNREMETVKSQLDTVRTARVNPLWDRNVKIARRKRALQRRLSFLQARLTELRQRGWARLKASERREYLNLKDVEIPATQAAVENAEKTQDTVLAELWQILEKEYMPISARKRSLTSQISRLKREIARKVTVTLQRVELNYYIIIQEKEKTYMRSRLETAKKHGAKVPRKYPRGRFQCIFHVDGFVHLETSTIMNIEPLRTLDSVMRSHAALQLAEYFNVYYDPEDFTLGATNKTLGDEELGKPPKLVEVARTVEGIVKPAFNPKEDWKTTREKYIMSQKDYNTLTASMTDYVAELKRLGKYQESL